VPGLTTTVATFDVNRQNHRTLAIKARFPHIALQTTMVAKVGVTSRKASIFLVFKIVFYVSQVIGHEFDTLPSFPSKRGHYLWDATLMPFYIPGAEMLSLRGFFVCSPRAWHWSCFLFTKQKLRPQQYSLVLR
jgi:hypothetical protein